MREERWSALAQEKREVLASMQEVLRSCHTLLNTTQIPMNGVVNLLQHILRCAPAGARPLLLPSHLRTELLPHVCAAFCISLAALRMAGLPKSCFWCCTAAVRCLRSLAPALHTMRLLTVPSAVKSSAHMEGWVQD